MITKLPFAIWSEAKDLLPNFSGLHAKIDLDCGCGPPNPTEHLTVHVDPQWLKITQLPIGAEYLLAAHKLRLRKPLPDDSFQAQRIAQDPMLNQEILRQSTLLKICSSISS